MDGVKREFDSWNRGHLPGAGMHDSVLPGDGRGIGEQRMEEWIRKLSYGNKRLNRSVLACSTLKISAIVQADFTEKLYKESLPFDKPVMKTVKRMMIQEETDSCTLYGKSGARLSRSGLRWFAGFITSGDSTYVFTLNMNGSVRE
ncbi:penicillin-binding transpeptidase domain-containing protein [Bacillus sp. FSL M8-0052]|uniref:penicillin-binding transpeptidase domain-containing protein n=1 Tax=Bacillus TaxID=1386 RepID=UPI002E7AA1B4|nr:penicillin-binding transpeptidase domain-containing protein [Bacillus glycinifermentans]